MRRIHIFSVAFRRACWALVVFTAVVAEPGLVDMYDEAVAASSGRAFSDLFDRDIQVIEVIEE
jgi:hypothetical protein